MTDLDARSSLLRSVVLAAAAILASLAVCELGLRAAGFPSRGVHSVSAESYAELPGMYEPARFHGLIRVRGLPHDLNINSLGFRGPEPQPVRDRPRVLFVGDSFTFGDHVNDEETLPAQVQLAMGGAIEVLNGGVSGSTIIDQRVFADRMLALAPDLVVLVYSENDLFDLAKDLPIHQRLAQNRVLRSGRLTKRLFFVASDLALFGLVMKARSAWEVRLAAAPANSASAGEPDIPAPRADRYCNEVATFRDDLARRGLSLVVALYPWPETVAGTAPAPSVEIVREGLSARGVDVVDLTPDLRASGLDLDELYLLPKNDHPSARGYEIAARPLARSLKELHFQPAALRLPAR